MNSTIFPAWESLQVKVQKSDGAQQVPLVEDTELRVQGSQSIQSSQDRLEKEGDNSENQEKGSIE